MNNALILTLKGKKAKTQFIVKASEDGTYDIIKSHVLKEDISEEDFKLAMKNLISKETMEEFMKTIKPKILDIPEKKIITC